MANPIDYDMQQVGKQILTRFAALEATIKTIEAEIDALQKFQAEAKPKLVNLR